MFRKPTYSESQATLDALGRSMAIIEFRMDGTILRANDSFLAVVGYDLREVEGRHHRIFVEDAIAEGHNYALLWQKLRAGEFVSGE